MRRKHSNHSIPQMPNWFTKSLASIDVKQSAEDEAKHKSDDRKDLANVESTTQSDQGDYSQEDNELRNDTSHRSTMSENTMIKIDNEEAQIPHEPEPDSSWTLVEQEPLNSTDSAAHRSSPDRQMLADKLVGVLRKELARQEDRVQELERDLREAQVRYEQSEAKHGALLQMYSTQLVVHDVTQSQKHQADISELKNVHQAEVRRLREQHRKDLDEQAKQNDEIIAAQDKKVNEASTDLSASKKQAYRSQRQLGLLKAEHAVEHRALREALEQRISQKSSQAEQYLHSAKDFQAKLESAILDHKAEILALKRQHASEIETFKRQHADNTRTRTTQWQRESNDRKAEHDAAVNKLRVQRRPEHWDGTTDPMQ
ncbi:hypothetical protein EJ03DRAFT_110263 [Teratosphaeria nubilosa]|uniref:Uncharacterized protein n=1 Tax=Teratosphaeria nubilosa TaxID=161662 RepID=A0A6G1L7G8_9PEZI|nr:hypothetical protein EJ03DRAFT_110263 [Teratosphaeria nubilosa]